MLIVDCYHMTNIRQPLKANFNKPLVAVGLMSGTSLDGIDAAVITTDGETIFEFGEFVTIPYSEDFRDRLRKAIDKARNNTINNPHILNSFQDPSRDPETSSGYAGVGSGYPVAVSGARYAGLALEFAEMEKDMTMRHAEAVEKLKVKADIIGFHGQTIIHKPGEGFTWQMGDGARLAEMTGMDVMNDFRSADIRAGGQGAPLVPIFHKAITEKLPKPVAIVNIGGVANITWIAEDGLNGNNLLAFDTGPGNAMINDIMKRYYGKEYDKNGEVAARGNVDEEVLARYLMDDYFYIKPPKSLDRNHFTLEYVKDLKPEDAVATLTAFTSLTILMSNYYFLNTDKPVSKFYIAGGGRLNKRIMKTLGSRAEPIEAIGYNGDAFEAQAFAYLAVRAKYGLPISFPTTTGCKASPLKDIARYNKA